MKKLFSLFAQAGAFVACQPEELETAFSVDPATVTIDVTVTDVQTGVAAEDVTVTCSDGAAKVEGNVITLTGNPAIDETTVTVAATCPKYAKAATKEVKINKVLGGGVANYNVVLVIGTPLSDYEITLVKVSEAKETKTGYVTGAEYEHSYTHDGIEYEYWRRNDTKFWIDFEVTYNTYSGSEVLSSDVIDPAFKQVVDGYVAGYNTGIVETPAKENFDVSAWCIYTVKQTVDYLVETYSVMAAEKEADNVEVGTFTVSTPSRVQLDYYEMADPESHGHGHYQPGHGHDDTHGHGAGNNAGGGIIFAE